MEYSHIVQYVQKKKKKKTGKKMALIVLLTFNILLLPYQLLILIKFFFLAFTKLILTFLKSSIILFLMRATAHINPCESVLWDI